MTEGADRRAKEAAFRSFLMRSTGFLIPEDRWRFLAPRFLDRIEGRGFTDVDAYLHYLETDPMGRTELEEIFSVLTVRKTSFFRNPASFDALGQEVIPKLAKEELGTSLPLTIWSAGCSTGEEPYSIAMVAREALRPLQRSFYLLASDIVKEALERARAGRYPEHALAGVPPDFRHHLTPAGGGIRVNQDVRDLVEFTEHNLVHDRVPRSAVGRWDIIFCRNVFIYFSAEQANVVLRRFAQVLRPGGALFLGHAEVFTGMEQDFEVVFWGDTFYYRRRRDPRVEPIRNPAPPTTPRAGTASSAYARTRRLRRPQPDNSETRKFRPPEVGAPPPPKRPRRDPADTDRYRTSSGQALTPTRAFRRDAYRSGATRRGSSPDAGASPPADLLAQARTRLKKNDPEGAARTLRAAISRAPTWAEPRIELARLYLRRGETDHAANQLETAVEVEPLNHGAHHLLGVLRAGAGDHERAEVSFRRALYLQPEFLEARLALAQTYKALQRTDRACRELRNVIRSIRNLKDGSQVVLPDGTTQRVLIQRCQGEINDMGGSLQDSGIWHLPPPADDD